MCLSPIDSNRSFPISSPLIRLHCDVILGFGFRVSIFLGFLLAGIEEDFLVQIPRLHVTWRHSSGIKWKGRSAFWISFWTIGLSKSYRLQFNTQPNKFYFYCTYFESALLYLRVSTFISIRFPWWSCCIPSISLSWRVWKKAPFRRKGYLWARESYYWYRLY